MTKFLKIETSDLWQYAGALVTSLIAGLFVIAQIYIQKKERDIQSRPSLNFSFTRADIFDEKGYIYTENFILDSIQNRNQYVKLDKAYFNVEMIPPTFCLNCFSMAVTKIDLYYKFTSQRSKTVYYQKVNIPNLNEGDSIYFVTTNMISHTTKNTMLNSHEESVPDTDYFPKNIKDEIIIVFTTLNDEKGVLIYNYNLKSEEFNNHISSRRQNFIIDNYLEQDFEVFYENDYNFPKNIVLDEKGNLITECEIKKSKLVKLNPHIKERMKKY